MERFFRTELLLGKEKAGRIRKARVTVVGLGAVGSYAVEALARSGVGHLRLMDFDKVSRTNINRNLFALEGTVGLSKCDVARERVRSINPSCRVEAFEVFAALETLEPVFAGTTDILVDAIDALNPKVQLLAEAHRRGITVISSMGASMRTDPSRIKVGDLFTTRNCPLARFIRKRLRKQGIEEGILCVHSDEPNHSRGVEYPGSENELQRGRPRKAIGSLSTVPGIFGLMIAHKAIEILCGGFGKETREDTGTP